MNNIIGYIISGIIICLLIIISIFNFLKKRDISNENKINIGNISLDFMKENFIYMFIMIVLVIFGLCIEIIFIPRKVAQISNKSSNMKPKPSLPIIVFDIITEFEPISVLPKIDVLLKIFTLLPIFTFFPILQYGPI